MSPRETIAHYRILSKLDQGGMGEVRRSTDARLGDDPVIGSYTTFVGRPALSERVGEYSLLGPQLFFAVAWRHNDRVRIFGGVLCHLRNCSA
jgi:hypothetical protein